MSIHFTAGKIAYCRLQTVGAVEGMVSVRGAKAVCLGCFADHRAPGVVDGSRGVRGFGRGILASGGIRPPDPVVIPVDRPEDSWLTSPQGNDLGEDALEFRAECLRRGGRGGRGELRPVDIVVVKP